ncbi:sensor histidine kinase [Flagellimonas myxillae]|uniref:sensor histidine kinase n=1 Tax=Flagellimonas myxillae TaxID=2942214 RepID=UPI00201EC686|nr:histidine kinase [Muricauda myxillae]MCL6266934.1 histidine kinase [Muricauda myxillae]
MQKQLLQSYKNLPIPFGKLGVAILIVSFFFIAKEYTNHLVNNYNYPFSWGFISLRIIINYGLWLVLAPCIAILTKRIKKKGKTTLTWAGIIMGVLIISLLHRTLATKLYDVAYYMDSGYMKEFFGPNGLVALVVGIFSSLIEQLVIFAVFLGADYQKQYLRNQQALVQAQISALQMQLHPHFLFNTLHSIASMIDIDTQKAQQMLAKIGALLRSMLENEMDQMTTLKNELEFIQHYLDLEQIRYADKMKIDYNIAENVLQAQVPCMILQPLVENAIKYGVVPALKNGYIQLEAKELNLSAPNKVQLGLTVLNSLEPNCSQYPKMGTGLGLKNTKKRLEGLYGNLYEFEAGAVNSKLYRARIFLPLKR